MRIWERFLHALGLIEVDAGVDGEEGYENKHSDKKNNVVRFQPPEEQYKLVVSKPTGFSEVEDTAGHLKGRRPVVVNLENLDAAEARRTVDFLSGVVFALNGTSQKISNHIFVFAPSGVSLSSEIKSRLARQDDRVTDLDPYFKDR